MLKNTFSIYVGIDVRSLVERAIVKNVIDHKNTPYVKQRSAVHAILEKTTLGKLNCKIYEKKWTVTSFKILRSVYWEKFFKSNLSRWKKKRREEKAVSRTVTFELRRRPPRRITCRCRSKGHKNKK